MQTTKTLPRILIFVCAMIFLSGCSVPSETVETIKTPTLTIETVEIVEQTPSKTPNLVPSATHTSLPNTPTFTPEASRTATSEPTWTPVPTLSQDTKKMNLTDLFTTNGGCDWPCFWGIQLGSPLQDALALSPVLGKSPYIYENQYTYILPLDELNLADFDVTFYEKDEAVQKIKVSLREPVRHTDYFLSFESVFSLGSVLSKYGKPTSILLEIQPRVEMDSPIGYALVLFYEASGFVIQYDGVVTSEEPIQVCVKLDDYHLGAIQVNLQDEDAMGSLREKLLSQEYQHLEHVTSMNIDDFFDAFVSSDTTNCIETSIDHWE